LPERTDENPETGLRPEIRTRNFPNKKHHSAYCTAVGVWRLLLNATVEKVIRKPVDTPRNHWLLSWWHDTARSRCFQWGWGHSSMTSWSSPALPKLFLPFCTENWLDPTPCRNENLHCNLKAHVFKMRCTFLQIHIYMLLLSQSHYR